MKKLLHHALRAMGYHLYSDGSLPPGIDWLLDVRKLCPDMGHPALFDVGANVGQTVKELHRSFPIASIYAFEPFREPFSLLQANTKGLAGVQTYQLALGAAPGRLRVPVRRQSVYNSLVGALHDDKPDAEPGSATEMLTVETVDRFCSERGIASIDILKTDTEGYDLEVLQGAAGMLTAGAVRFVFSEVTFCAGNKQNTSFAAVHDYLARMNFRFLGLYELYPMQHYPEPNVFCNALFVCRT